MLMIGKSYLLMVIIFLKENGYNIKLMWLFLPDISYKINLSGKIDLIISV
jgi:hypothetical protein